MEWVADQLGFRRMSDWYKVRQQDIEARGGAALLAKFQWSPLLLLSDAYPEHAWHSWRFGNISRKRGRLEEKEKVDEFLKKALARVPEDARKKEVDYFGKTISHIEYYITEEVPLPGEKKKSDADEGLGLAQEIPVIIEYGHVDNVLLLAPR